MENEDRKLEEPPDTQEAVSHEAPPPTEQITVTVRPIDEPESSDPDTGEAEQQTKPHRAPRLRIDDEDEDNPDLVVTWYEKVRHKDRWKTRSTWYRHERRIALRATDLVDMRYATKTNTTFTPQESRIDYLRRLHWMSHGPEQIGFAILWLAGLALIGTASELLTQTEPSGLLMFGLGLILTLACGIAALRSWMKWAYTYLICTDVRIILIYHPPFKLPPKIKVAQLSRLQGCNASSSWLGNALNYGTIRSDTAAHSKDEHGNDLGEWLEKGIKYAPEYVRLHALLTSPA